VVSSNEISGINLDATEGLTNFNFSEYRSEDTTVQVGQTATIGFWYGKAGRKLLKNLNGTKSSTKLGDYLATEFPNMFGDMSGMKNSQVASRYKKLYKDRYIKSENAEQSKLELEALSLALSTYVTQQDHVQHNVKTGNATDSTLIAEVEAFGFLVTDGGVGAATYDLSVWLQSGYDEAQIKAAFNITDDNLVVSVMDLLKATDANSGSAQSGSLYDFNEDGISDFEQIMRDIANSVYTDINNMGSV